MTSAKCQTAGLLAVSLVLFFFVSAGSADAALPSSDNSTLTAAIESAQRTTGVPAVVVIAVDRERVLYVHAFGFADLARQIPATTETPFYIASATKSFTGLAATILAAEGRLDLDAPLTKSLPKLHLRPPLDTSRMSLRDLLNHRLGFENSGINLRTAYSGEFDENTIWRLAEEESEPTERIFHYDNLGYIFAGYAIGAANGNTWKNVVESRILVPLGMRATSPYPIRGAAKGYAFVEGAWHETPAKAEQTMHAAGGMYASVEDLGRWIRAQLNLGKIDGKTLLNPQAVRQAQAPQIGLRKRFFHYDRYAYGFGWYHSDYDGQLLMHSFGGFSGAEAHLSFMPERGVGVAVLTNANGQFAHVIASYIYDVVLGKPEAATKLADESKRLAKEFANSEKSRHEAIEQAEEGLPFSALSNSHPLSWHEGTYVSQSAGTLRIQYVGNKLYARYGLLTGSLQPLKGDAFLLQLFPDSTDIVFFRGSNDSSADTLTWDGDDFNRK